MKVTILGCGPSYGIPNVGSGFGQCDPKEPKNTRSRSSIFLEDKDTALLIDTSPDLRQQLFSAQIKHIDAVLWTHMHADHTAGMDDLRAFSFIGGPGTVLDGYLADGDKDEFCRCFAYYIQPMPCSKAQPLLNLHTLTPGKAQKIKNLDVLPILQEHGARQSLGFRVGDFAYSTDFNHIAEDDLALLKGVRVWVVACQAVSVTGHKHLGLDDILALIEHIKPERAYLTHMGMSMDYQTLLSQLPPYVRPAYDGLTIEI